MDINGSSTGKTKEAYRALYAIVKQIDEDKLKHKLEYTSVSSILNDKVERERLKLVKICRNLIFQNCQVIGKKTREILWRKGFYEFIAFAKKVWSNNSDKDEEKLRDLLLSGIMNYKHLAKKTEEVYDLDLKLLVDFTILDSCQNNNDDVIDINSIVTEKSLESISFALDTIHSSLLSLGDLHRYFVDFKINYNEQKITKSMAAKFYNEAFKLNPAIGMSQNQLGTLFYGQNHDLDSIYHYLYSLVCNLPFELSENNVCKLFTKHVDYLESLDPNKVEFSLKDFYARFYLIVDILFFDKEVPEFNNLCHCVLVDLRKILCSKMIDQVGADGIFKIVSILFFCMSKLKMINSPKLYSLNAFMVAVVSDLVDSCIVNLEQALLTHAKQNEKFQDMYVKRFTTFETEVRRTRDNYKQWIEQGDSKNDLKKIKTVNKKKSDCESCPIRKTENGENGDQCSTKSSDEAKESDLKTPLSNKSKKKGAMVKLRRRRKKITAEQTDEESSCYDTDTELDTDFTSDEDEYSDLSSNFESDFSDIEDDPNQFLPNLNSEEKNNIKSYSDEELIVGGSGDGAGSDGKYPTFSDNEDIVIEEEEIIYPNREDDEEMNSEELIRDFEVVNLNFEKYSDDFRATSPTKLKYKNMYSKIDPNIVIDFMLTEPTAAALKILFDWLRINSDILLGCYHSNPEFVHKIIKLVNFCNIDIFTKKNYFDRSFIKASNVRENLGELFNIRTTLPLPEDYSFKSFDIFQSTQIQLDWEAKIRESLTSNEESMIRIFKIIDFGFFICKKKKFNYNFCTKSRKFIESNINKKKRENDKKCPNSRRREKRSAKNSRRRVEGRTRRYSDRKNGIIRKCYTSNEEKDTVEEDKSRSSIPKKCYLRSRNQQDKIITNNTSSGADEERSEALKNDKNIIKKCELMGKLWLKNEVENLENELKNNPIGLILTPFLVVDAKALTEYFGLVKNFVKSKKSIVLIPNAVLNELDELKKRSENARNVIRWLEQEFKHGNRFLRSQRQNENLSLALLKIPRKLDRESSVFVQIAQFCNHVVSNHTTPNCDDFQPNVVTYLSGDNLNEKKLHKNLNFTGILDSIPVKHYQISNFYAKFKNINKK